MPDPTPVAGMLNALKPPAEMPCAVIVTTDSLARATMAAISLTSVATAGAAAPVLPLGLVAPGAAHAKDADQAERGEGGKHGRKEGNADDCPDRRPSL